jgi:very-short-patch-repair endonuclease
MKMKKILKNKKISGAEKIIDTEKVLWVMLNAAGIGGGKFYRRHSIGRYTVDFYWPAEKVAIELDAENFSRKNAYDKTREKFLKSQGIKILRIKSEKVFEALSGFRRKILMGG